MSRTLIESRGDEGLALCGRWSTDELAAVRAAVARIEGWQGARLRLQGEGLDYIDPIPAWLLYRALERLRRRGVEVEDRGLGIRHFELFRDLPALPTPEPLPPLLPRELARLGHAARDLRLALVDFLGFLGHALTVLFDGLRHPRRLRLRSVSFHVNATGIQAIPIVALIAFLISVVLAYQGAAQLTQFGASIYTIDLVAISVLREMGVLLTAIMVAGRSGSAFAAEIGVMKSNEEIDALRTMGLDPFEILVVPRLLALVLVLPLLTLIADLVGLVGAALLSITMLDLSLSTFLVRLAGSIEFHTFWVGIVKAPFFALIIGLIGTWRGMQVTGSAESVGRLTTRAVVESIFLVIAADALFSILFARLGI